MGGSSGDSFVQRQFKPAWFDEADIRAHLVGSSISSNSFT
jgi:hypothetical protein